MPHLDFYATARDFEQIFEFIFTHLPVRVFESYSQYDQNIIEFKNYTSITEKYTVGQCNGTAQSVLLQLWPIHASEQVSFDKINLKMKEHSFRYRVSGWGLIQLYLGGINENEKTLIHSYTNHNSEKRAIKWQETSPEMGRADKWDWQEVNRVSRNLNAYIRKLSVSKIGSRPILENALSTINRDKYKIS